MGQDDGSNAQADARTDIDALIAACRPATRTPKKKGSKYSPHAIGDAGGWVQRTGERGWWVYRDESGAVSLHHVEYWLVGVRAGNGGWWKQAYEYVRGQEDGQGREGTEG